MRVLVTGGTGFVGANLVRRLLADGHQVDLLVRPGARLWRLAGVEADVILHEGDLGDDVAVRRVVESRRPEWIFNMAVHGGYSWQTDAGEMARTNLVGTMNLVQAGLRTGFEAFVGAGSSSEYGFKDHAPPETEWLEPNSDYAVTKAAATLYCRSAAQRHRQRITTLRLYSVFGPWEEPGRLMPTLILKGLEGGLPPLVSPDTARDFVYADDVSEACVLAASRTAAEPGAVYNVGTGVQTSMRDVVDVARSVLGITEEPRWGSMADRQWDSSVWVADSRRIRRELGWAPRHGFEAGFRRMADWLRDTPGVRTHYHHQSPR
ncbi:MAG TPA: NAD-dependent epimerase/dehydratase family protein [Candidatus Limnocylindrales bacterium]|nr:NAD-dependent epimerase/dehydratase family protein [Candidatus Limnocylindrales bacterium]